MKTREYTNKILELVDDGIVDKDWLIQGLLMWLSERGVEQFYDANLRPDGDEDDGQPSEMDEWHDYDPGC